MPKKERPDDSVLRTAYDRLAHHQTRWVDESRALNVSEGTLRRWLIDAGFTVDQPMGAAGNRGGAGRPPSARPLRYSLAPFPTIVGDKFHRPGAEYYAHVVARRFYDRVAMGELTMADAVRLLDESSEESLTLRWRRMRLPLPPVPLTEG